jgi:selenocysteine-specific elongation factor
VRSIESHDQALEVVGPRRRVALNLAGIRREDVARGDVVTAAGADLSPTYRLDVRLIDRGEGAASAILGERRVQVHHGTRESPARVVDLDEGAAQLRLEQPLLARRGERVVIRRIAPPDTLGGAVILDPSPPRHSSLTSRPDPSPQSAADQSEVPADDSRCQATGKRHASSPAEPGALGRRVLAQLEGDGDRPRTPAKLAEDLGTERREVEAAIGELVEAGAVVRFKADVAYPTATARRLEDAAVALVAASGSTSIAEVRDALGLSRKYAQALLEHLDGERVLRRDGDRHLLRGRAAT